MSLDYTLLLTGGPLRLDDGVGRSVAVAAVAEGQRSRYAEEWGLTPTHIVRFTVDKGDRDRSLERFAKAVAGVLSTTEGDLVLLQNGELPVLRRNGSNIAVSPQSDLAAHLALFPAGTSVADLGGVDSGAHAPADRSVLSDRAGQRAAPDDAASGEKPMTLDEVAAAMQQAAIEYFRTNTVAEDERREAEEDERFRVALERLAREGKLPPPPKHDE